MENNAPAVVNGSSNGAAQPAPPRSSTDSFVNAGLEALADLTRGGKEPARDAPSEPRPEEQRPAREDGDAEDEESLPGAGDAEGDEGDHGEAGDEGEEHDTRGSRENPIRAKDLAKDSIHVEVRVDGKTEVVTLREAIDGYVGQKTIHQRLNQTKALADEVQALRARSLEEKQQVTQAVREVLGDPHQLYDYLMQTEDREQVLFQLAHRYAEQMREFRQSPEKRLLFQRQRDLARIQAEREHFESQRRAEAEAQQRRQMEERAMNIFRPGWEAGLRKAGFPQMDASQQQELLQEVMVRCEQRRRAGHDVSSDDVAEFVVRAAKLLELPPKGAKRPKPAPQALPKDRAPAARRRGEDPWAGKSARQKLRDPSFFLQGLKPRDFR